MVGLKNNIMKKLFILLFIAGNLLQSCSKDETKNVSKVTIYPVIKLNGSNPVVITQGGTYTEQGAIALAGTQTLPLTTEGSVNTSNPGIYEISYSTLNDDGFEASNTRTVIVLSSAPSSINLEGVFARNGNINNVTKLSDRKYICDNATGYTTGNENNITLEFYNIDDSKIYAPFQENTSSTGISAKSSLGNIISVNKFNWIIYASGFFGQSVRTFTRQ